MTIIAELPAEIRNMMAANPEQEERLWEWVSQMHYAQVVAQAGPTHELVALKARFDFTALEQACQAYRLYEGKQGVEATHSLRQLCLGVVLKTYHGWSYEVTAARVRSDNLLRWFAGYRLNQRTFSPATLWRLEMWLKERYPRLLFNLTLQQIDQDFPAEATAPQIGDTFAMQARTPAQSRTQLLRTSSRRLLDALRQVTPTVYAEVVMSMAGETLFGAAHEKPACFLDKAERDAQEERTAVAAHGLLTLVQAAYAPLPVSRDVTYLTLGRWLSLLHKVLHDEFTWVLDDQGNCVQAAVRTHHEKGSYAIGSAIDPAPRGLPTFRLHGDRCDLGFNISLAATLRFVRETAAFTGAMPDSKVVAPAIAMQLEQLGLVPPKFIYDRAAGTPKIYAEVDKASEGQTQLVARLIHYGKSNPRLGPPDCTLNEEGVLTCPAGQITSRAYRSQSGDGWTYRFLASQCQGCPLFDLCRDPKAKPTSPRNFFISDYAYQQRRALLYLKTEACQQDLRLRPLIERIIANLVRSDAVRITAPATPPPMAWPTPTIRRAWPPSPSISSSGFA